MNTYVTAFLFFVVGLLVSVTFSGLSSSDTNLSDNVESCLPVGNVSVSSLTQEKSLSHEELWGDVAIVKRLGDQAEGSIYKGGMEKLRVENNSLQWQVALLKTRLEELDGFKFAKDDENRMDAITADVIELKDDYPDEIRSRFSEQDVNVDWAYNRENELYNLFGDDKYLKELPVNSYECRSTQCRVEVLSKDNMLGEKLITHLSTLAKDGKLGSRESSFLLIPNSSTGVDEIYFTSDPRGFSLSEL
ncbi:MAG: hypothetical protein COA42_14665 [Alteromonadaceae bacterium]|nr:hypothetical protein [Colwellia sp.]PCK07378.1 MAG: hypothetical protein COA42_14665 [Alteromonadaceae bacterium]